MIPEDEPVIKREDSTPTLANQCAEKGWEFGFYDFGKGEQPNRTFFNPGLVQRSDGLWLMARVSEINDNIGLNSIFAFKLDDTGKIPQVGYKLLWPQSEADEQHEDPRVTYLPSLNQTCVCATNFRWFGFGSSPAWTGATQVLGFFDEEWNCKVKHRPPIGGNPRSLTNIEPKQYEKSWLPFFAEKQHHDLELHLMYAPQPWRIYRFGDTWEDFSGYEDKQGISWKYGVIRNGTPPVLVNGEYITFFHSSLPWQGSYRRYYMGCVAFEAKAPFKPLRLTTDPLLSGSQQDPWAERKPPCIFPGGAVLRDGIWHIVCGINDLRCGWIRMEHASLLKNLKPVQGNINPIISKVGLSEGEIRLAKLRANAAKARAAKAAKKVLLPNEVEVPLSNGEVVRVKKMPKRRIKRRRKSTLAKV